MNGNLLTFFAEGSSCQNTNDVIYRMCNIQNSRYYFFTLSRKDISQGRKNGYANSELLINDWNVFKGTKTCAYGLVALLSHVLLEEEN